MEGFVSNGVGDMETEDIGRLLLDNTAEIILFFEEDGTILFGNQSAAEKLSYTVEGLKEHTMAEFFRQEFQQAGAGQTAFNVAKLREKKETVMYREKSSCFPAAIRIVPAEEGRYLLFAQDITWQKDVDTRIRALKEEQKENLRMRDEFTANVTHELRTPINGIKGHVSSIIDGISDAEVKKTLKLVLYCCDNVSAIINNILDFSKLEANKFLLEEREFDFYQMMDSIVAVHMAEVNKKELGMQVTVGAGIPQYMIGDSLRIGQILNNLLSNAVKFTKVGKITVDVTKTEQNKDVIELFFMVRDSGIGISKEEQDKLFQSFTQADASVTRNFGGTGLGLCITKQLVEMMGGTIWVESEKGKGSCFSFCIKLHAQRTETDENKAAEQIKNSWNNLVGDREASEERMYVFGSPENRKEIENRMERLVLSIELGSWDKAEMLTDTVKSLTGGDASLKRVFLRLEMAIRKENYEGSIEGCQNLKLALEEKLDGTTV